MTGNHRIQDRRVVPAGAVLIREGEDADAAYILQSGALGVYKAVDGAEILLAILRPGSIVGEMALLDSGRRSATVRAMQRAELIRIPREHFDRKVESADPFTRALLQMFTQKVRKLTANLTEAERKLRLHEEFDGLTEGIEDDSPNSDITLWRTAVLYILRRYYPRGDQDQNERLISRDEVYGEILSILLGLGLQSRHLLFAAAVRGETEDDQTTTAATPTPR